jgi:hypothetical protein
MRNSSPGGTDVVVSATTSVQGVMFVPPVPYPPVVAELPLPATVMPTPPEPMSLPPTLTPTPPEPVGLPRPLEFKLATVVPCAKATAPSAPSGHLSQNWRKRWSPA